MLPLLTSLQTLATGFPLHCLGCTPGKTEEMEASLRSVVKATSWMDWWTHAMKFLSLKSAVDTCLVHRLSLAGVRRQLLAKTALTLWANVVLKRRGTVLAKAKDSVSFESFMNLCNANISSGTEVFPADVLDKAVVKTESSFQRQASFSRVGAPLFRYSSPHSQPQVRAMLNQHCRACKSCGTNVWMAAVLQGGYHIPFHHLPPVERVPR